MGGWIIYIYVILFSILILAVSLIIQVSIERNEKANIISAAREEYIKDELSKDFMLKVHKSIRMDKEHCKCCGKEHWACYMYSINWSDELYCKDCIEDLKNKYSEDLNSENCGKYLDILRQLP